MIDEAAIRRLAARIEERDGVSPAVAMARAAEWAANKVLAESGRRPLAKATNGRPECRGRSLQCSCERCRAWRFGMDARRRKAGRDYSSSSGGW